MKQRLLSIVAALSLMVSTAVAQTISFSDFEARPGRNKTVEFSALGVNEMTALQFNLSLPEGFSLSEDVEGENLDASGVKTGHEQKVLLLENGDYLVVLYNMYLNTFSDNVSFTMTLKTSEDCGVKEGRIYNVRMATVDAVSHICEGVSFKAMVSKPVNGISLDKDEATLTEGKSMTLVATVSPDDATDKTVTWSSSNTSVATVVDGVVTAIAPGTATITATAGGYSATCVVTVEAAVEPEPEGLSTSKYYRVKNVTTGLYLQVEGNNTNMKLQNKAEGLAMMQIFGLEDAGEGMYYITAADSDNNYYAHASGWNFNATTNADNKTPFTIALVEGETEVYTLHQSVSAYPGLAGADDAAAGAAIYCNKGVDNNGKWAFEPLTEAENAAYTATLTATAKAALDAAIARGEQVVSTRSAVLTAEEVAAINGAVQAAEEAKDAATEVAALKALSDAIHTAVDAAIYVWSIDELSSEVCYAVSTEDRGAWYAQAANLTSTTKAGVAVDVTDKKQQFAFVQSPETGALYLYSVSEEKFVKVEGSNTALTEAPVQTITFLAGTRSAKYPWVVALNAEDGQKQMGISNGYDPAVITFYNDLGDGGNTVRIEKASTFDATAALAAIKALETGIEKSEIINHKSEIIFDLQGRRVEKATKGIYIVGGKKVVMGPL